MLWDKQKVRKTFMEVEFLMKVQCPPFLSEGYLWRTYVGLLRSGWSTSTTYEGDYVGPTWIPRSPMGSFLGEELPIRGMNGWQLSQWERVKFWQLSLFDNVEIVCKYFDIYSNEFPDWTVFSIRKFDRINVKMFVGSVWTFFTAVCLFQTMLH